MGRVGGGRCEAVGEMRRRRWMWRWSVRSVDRAVERIGGDGRGERGGDEGLPGEWMNAMYRIVWEMIGHDWVVGGHVLNITVSKHNCFSEVLYSLCVNEILGQRCYSNPVTFMGPARSCLLERDAMQCDKTGLSNLSKEPFNKKKEKQEKVLGRTLFLEHVSTSRSRPHTEWSLSRRQIRSST